MVGTAGSGVWVELRTPQSGVGAVRRTSGRSAGWVMAVVGGAVLLATRVPAAAPLFDPWVALVALLAGLAAGLAPWDRWPARAQLVLPLLAFGLIAAAGLTVPESLRYIVALVPLPFVYVGFTQRRGTCVLLAPMAMAPLAFALTQEPDRVALVNLVLAVPAAVAVGEAIASVLQRWRRAERRVGRLLQAVRDLDRAHDEATCAQLIADLGAALLDAEAAAVLLPSADGDDGCFRIAAECGHPSLRGVLPRELWSSPLHGGAVAAAGHMVLLPDAARSMVIDPAAASRGKVRSAALLPLLGDHGVVGIVVVLFMSPRRIVGDGTRHAADLLAVEAGRTLERLRATSRLRHEAGTDPLTGLANRRTFDREFDDVGPGDAVVLVDLDHFKAVNDQHGHDIGDHTIWALAQCLRQAARQGDCVARFGGEEFALLLSGAGEHGAKLVMDRLAAAWRRTDPLTTYSAGVAVGHLGEPPAAVLRRADQALYRAKQQGRDRVEYAADEITLP